MLADAPIAQTELTQIASSALETNPHLKPGQIRIEAAEGRIRLHGHAGSFFEKQMAQEAILRLDGVEQVENLIEVAWA